MNIELGKVEKETPYVMEYIRKRTKAGNVKIGMVVAALVDGKIRIGWSLAKQKGAETDTFEVTEGFQRSFERILNDTTEKIPILSSPISETGLASRSWTQRPIVAFAT